MDNNPERPTKRARTDAQLEQKRKVDRLKQKSNRAESKTRLENIEKDVTFLRETMGAIMQQLNGLSSLSNLAGLAGGMQPPQGSRNASLELPDVSSVQSSNSPGASSSRGTPLTDLSVRPSPSMNATLNGNTELPAVVDCVCGMKHEDISDCLEYKSFAMLYESHRNLSESPRLAMTFPINPTVPNLLLHSIDDNPLTKLVGSALRQFKTYNTTTLCGLYFLTYRLLRWRAHPNPQWYADVPDLMKPTEIQNTELHPLCLDFLPWPRLRNHICLTQNTDGRHSVALYLECIKLDWPSDKDLFVRDRVTGKVELHADFEAFVCDVQSWKLTERWYKTFPHLVKHVEG